MLTENPEEAAAAKVVDKGAADSQEEDEDSSDDSVSEVNEEQFQQHNYLFLFDEELGISKEAQARQEALTPEHFVLMKRINRRRLCEFFDKVMADREVPKDIVVEVSHVDGPGETIEVKKRVITVSEDESSRSVNTDMQQANKKGKDKPRFPTKDRESFAKEWEEVPDEEIDANFQLILQRKQNGQYLTPEVVAHFEYFMNTLNMSHKNQTENPFDQPLKYPALQYRGMTILKSQTNSDAIMESAE